MEILREVTDQHLSCSICMDQYTDPKQLPCLHSFCRKCLATHILKTFGGSGGVSFQCPVCRTVCKPANPDPRKVQQWVDSFPDNFFIKGLIDTFEAQQRDAVPIPVEDQLRSMSVEAETCPKHRKEMVVSYCVVRKLGVCSICLKSSAHDDCAKNHLSPAGARKFASERLQNFKHRIETLSSRVHSAEAKLAARPDELKFKKEELAIEISQYFSELRTQINKVLLRKEKETLDQLKEVIKRENAKVSEARDETKSLSGSLTSTEQLFDKIMENRPVGALSVAGSVENQIAAYESATSKVESGCNKLDITLHTRDDIGTMIENLSLGNIHVGGETEGAVGGSNQIPFPTSTEQNASYHLSSATVRQAHNDRFSGASPLTSNKTGKQKSEDETTSVRSVRCESQPSPSPSVPNSDERLSNDQRFHRPNTPDPLAASTAALNASHSQASADSSVFHADPGNPENAGASLQSIETSLPLPVLQTQSLPANVSRGFQFRLVQEFNGLCPNDTHSASYVGACPFGENCLIIVDRWNKKLKLIQVGGRILLFLEFPDQMEPWDVTPVTQDRVAVTCPGYTHILMIEVLSTDMKICRYIKTSAGYSSLAHLNENRFAAGVCKPFGFPHVDILDTSSSEARVIMVLPSSVTYPRTLDLTLDRNLLICDWSQKELSVFDSGDFQLLLRYKGAGRDAVLREPVGTTKDKQGSLYVLDRKTKKIHVVSSTTGEMLAVMPLDVPSDPKVVVIVEAERCYSTRGEVLVVALGNGKLFVYDLLSH